LKEVVLPEVNKKVSPRAGIQSAYAAIAKSHPDNVFIISCDLDASTKLDKARTFLKDNHQFEMSIEEQASALMANGLAMCSDKPQFNVFSTFAAFFEGIAREGFEMWRYQRNLTGINEGLNVTFHLSHIGACTGRDHFSGWSLDWITLALGYLPYLHRFYAPADTGAAFLAVKDAAAYYGGHIIGIPRDNLPVLTKQNSTDPLWTKEEDWQTITEFRKYQKAERAILALGAPAHLADEAAKELNSIGLPTDVIIVNALPVTGEILNNILSKYPAGIVTIEDGLIGNMESGLRGFAGMMAGYGHRDRVAMAHVGITDPAIAPSEGHYEVWEHFGITKEALIKAVQSL
jgi:transketolase C-terminal domain/subunit